MAKVTFLGLGVMGYPMAAHLMHKAVMRLPFTTAPQQKPKNGLLSMAEQWLRRQPKPQKTLTLFSAA